ncbi:HNH endonuclease [Halosolutus halophilus]|uniref:HNH endonuclease n=1 Tax=Halosolutus halophilus TaxID=1552990 RepID=UPI0022350C6D|nr:HNH endonuclease signature motif containing protein [Halosolutus halophilus]
MPIDEISRQQLNTHPEIGWNTENPDMALQRVNWLRSLGRVQEDGDQYRLTEDGRQFTDNAVETWAETAASTASSTADPMTAGTYKSTVNARAIDPEFRATALARFDHTCPISDVDHPGLLDVAHVLSWSDYPEHRADLSNVLALSKTHHAAFDQELFTIDRGNRLRVNPNFDTESDLLRQTILDQAGERLPLPDGCVDTDYVAKHNAALAWV